MKLVFMGTPEFAVKSLEALYHSHHEILAVVTVPDKPSGRGQKISTSSVKKMAGKFGLSIYQPENLRDDSFVAALEALKADIFVVVAFRILPEKVFSLPPGGSVNLHASLLPSFRGAAPINRAIMAGADETGVSTFFLKKKVDTGNLILSSKVKIHPNMTAGELHDILTEKGAETLLRTLGAIEKNEVEEEVQDESLASPAPKIFSEDCKIDWSLPVLKIHNIIRGLDPYPGAFTLMNGKKLKLFSSKLVIDNIYERQPGEISVNKDSLSIFCQGGHINVFEIQLEGKKRMKVRDYLLGHNISNKVVLS